jgi:hypothetical protein
MTTVPDGTIRIGYHRLSDDSVSSSSWPLGVNRDNFIAELIIDPDIDHAWWRIDDQSDPVTIKNISEFRSCKPEMGTFTLVFGEEWDLIVSIQYPANDFFGVAREATWHLIHGTYGDQTSVRCYTANEWLSTQPEPFFEGRKK